MWLTKVAVISSETTVLPYPRLPFTSSPRPLALAAPLIVLKTARLICAKALISK